MAGATGKRMKAAESRRALLDAGLELLQARGVAPGLDRVTLKDAIEVSGVPRSTAYRLYEGGPGQLEAFRRDLLGDLDQSIDVRDTESAVTQVLESHEAELASGDPKQLAVVLREVIRVGMKANVDSVLSSVEWRVYMSALASVPGQKGFDSTTSDLYNESSFEFGQRFVTFFEVMAGLFGLRPRAPLTVIEFASLVAAITEGVALRQQVDPTLEMLRRPTGPNGEIQAWHGAAVAIEGVVLIWGEPDPDSACSADLHSWMAASHTAG